MPALVGLPETAVPPPVKLRPGGSVPALRLAAAKAPVKLIDCEYAVPAMPEGVAILIAGKAEMVWLTDLVAVEPFASERVITKDPMEAEVAVPDSAAVVELKAAPGGRAPVVTE